MKKENESLFVVVAIIFGIAAGGIANFIGLEDKLQYIIGIAVFIYMGYLRSFVKGENGIDRAFAKLGEHVFFCFVLLSYTLFIVWLVKLIGLTGTSAFLIGLLLYAGIASVFSLILVFGVGKNKKKKPGSD